MPNLDLYSTPLTAKTAAHLLRRATFGPTPAEIAAFSPSTGMTATQAVQTLMSASNINYNPPQPIDLDETNTTAGQFFLQNASTPAGQYLPFVGDDNSGHQRDIVFWWFKLMIQPGPVNLLDKLTLFWQNHFVTTRDVVDDYRFMWSYLKLLRDNSLGNFRTLVTKISTEPAMLRYLNGDMNESGVGKANENYARELQELFVVGAVDFAGNKNYYEDDVKNAAKVLTGWKYTNYYKADSTSFATTFTANKHDTSTKTFSEKYGNKPISTPTTVPPGFANVGEYELSELVTMLLAHPHSPRFICRKLYRWYVNTNVTPAIETSVIIPLANLLVSSNWEIRPVIEKLLTSQIFFDPANMGSIIKSPAEFEVGMMRFFDIALPSPSPSDVVTYRKTIEFLYYKMRDLQLDPLLQPTVFGYDAYYQTGYSERWVNTTTMAIRNDLSDRLTNSQAIYSGSTVIYTLDVKPLARATALQPNFGDITTNTAVPPGTPPITCVQVLDSFLINLLVTDLVQTQKDFLIDTIMMQSVPRSSWEFEWNTYRRTVTYPASYTTSQINNAKNAVNNRLKKLNEIPTPHGGIPYFLRAMTMNRRKFLMNASSMALPLALNGFGLKALAGNSTLVQSLLAADVPATDRVMVIVYMNGGNDGLNMVIPLDQMSGYNTLRSNIAIPENKVLTLASNAATGLHPAMTGLRDLYNDGKLSIVHSVSYPNPDQSHYRSTDIWMTGEDSNQTYETGWAGRYLNDRYPNYPTGYPNTQMEDPLAIQIGYLTSTALLGPTQSMGIAINDPNSFYSLVGAAGATSPDYLPCCDAGDLIAYIRKQQALSVGYATEIKTAYDAGQTRATYPTAGQNSLADQLKIVARLVHGGLKTKIYFVSIGGFDTHSAQVDTADNSIGGHATLLGKLSAGIKVFQDDLALQGIADKVIGMTFSEFGRRANSNNSKGTDHGIAAPMFVFGSSVKRSTIGTNPDLANLTTSSGGNKDVPMQIDFRRVYSDVLNDWFGSGVAKTNSLLFRSSPSTLDFPTVSLFRNEIETVASGAWNNKAVWTVGRQPFPSEFVRVNTGHTVTIGQDTTVKNIKLDGKIQFTGNYKLKITG